MSKFLTPEPLDPESHARIERELGRVLLTGVCLAAALLVTGLTLWVGGAPAQWTNGSLNAGLLVLMATPMLRVVLSLVEFARARDWLFVLATLGVLGVLFSTIIVALAQSR